MNVEHLDWIMLAFGAVALGYLAAIHQDLKDANSALGVLNIKLRRIAEHMGVDLDRRDVGL